ncbi:DUF2637 domain-containing protein [Micromonospora sp. WMMD961]|uniref:DUF2637 domain-containing protein n=1 Tax=Micromonospora sp. WMMD961 TaxID=3016100 RepID=UPI00241631BD|nr:DUF2637 domain-containing protein [Micromonospora sp. WMMD961]MDG4783210.1 DUF2637 domain-containing protein [Micromonospora sp. WMMD961]
MTEKTPTGGRVEGAIQVGILLLVGLTAMAASFTHVHDWTMNNSPAGTPDAFGWANAVISELLPTGSLLEIRRRSRRGKSIGFPVAVLLGSTAFSLTANLAGAVPTISGWLVAGLPAVAFMVLTKMVLGGLASKAVPVPDEVPLKVASEVPVRRVPSQPVPVPAAVPARPAPVPSTSEPAIVVPGPERRVRKAGTGTADDEVLKAKLKDVIKNEPAKVLTRAGTPGVKLVAAALGTGPDRARRLIAELDQVPVPA